jgi:ParB-like chromosome segregation protein Spo0J
MPNAAYLKTRDLPLFGPGRRDIFAADPWEVKIDPNHNPRRFDTPKMVERVAQLKASILQSGVEQPLKCRRDGNDVWLVDGETRLIAARELVAEGAPLSEKRFGGWRGTVPIVVVECEGIREQGMQALRANDGLPLTKLEQGRKYVQILLIDTADGFTVEQAKQRIADGLGVRGRHVTECLSLAELPIEIQGMIEREEVSGADALRDYRQAKEQAVDVLKAKVAAKPKGEMVKREKEVLPLVECPRCSDKKRRRLVEFQGETMCKLCVIDIRKDIAQEEMAKAKNKSVDDSLTKSEEAYNGAQFAQRSEAAMPKMPASTAKVYRDAALDIFDAMRDFCAEMDEGERWPHPQAINMEPQLIEVTAGTLRAMQQAFEGAKVGL